MALQRKEVLFKESLRLIHNKGFKGTTMRDIASAMNCDVANLYNFINSKEEILETTLFEVNKVFHDEIDQIIASQYSPADQIKLIIELYVRLTFEDPYRVSLLVKSWHELNDNKKDEFLTEKRRFENKVKSVITLGIKDKSFRKMDATLATNLVLSSVRWLFERSTELKKHMNRFEIQRQITQFVFEGLKN